MLRMTALATAALACASTPGQASESSELVFPDERKLSLTWDQVRLGETIRLCNTGDDVAGLLDVTLEGFGFVEDGGPRQPSAVLEPVQPDEDQLGPGRCTTTTLEGLDRARLDPGEYSGVLAATAAGAGIARKEITLTSPEPPPTPAVPTGAREAHLTATRAGPIVGSGWDEVWMSGSGQLALKAEPPKQQLPELDEGTFVGNVFKDDEIGELYVDGAYDRSQMGVVLVPLTVEGIDEVGEYKGAADLVGDGKNEIPVKLTVTDAWWCAVIALLLGTAIALLPQFWRQKWGPRRTWRLRLAALPGEYRAASTYWVEHRRKNPELPALGRPSRDAVKRHAAKIDDAMKRYSKRTVFFDPSSDSHKEIEAAIEAAESDARCYKQEDGLAKALGDLISALRGLGELLLTRFPVERKPRLLRKAKALLKDTEELEVGEATKRESGARATVKLIEDWRRMAGEVRRYRIWGLYLQLISDRMIEEDAELLQRATAKVQEARSEMIDAEDAAALDALRAAEDLRRAYDALAYLGGRYELWVDPDWADWDVDPETLAARGRSELAELRPAMMFNFAGGIGGAINTIQELFRGVSAGLVDTAAGLSLAARSPGLWDRLALLLSLVIAVLSGLTLFYFGKPFGTTQDYLSVLLLGTATPVVVKAITDGLAARRGAAEPTAAPSST